MTGELENWRTGELKRAAEGSPFRVRAGRAYPALKIKQTPRQSFRGNRTRIRRGRNIRPRLIRV